MQLSKSASDQNKGAIGQALATVGAAMVGESPRNDGQENGAREVNRIALY